MHNLDPNDMDALFREGAEKHEFTYNPEAWAMMEEKLDEKNRRKYFLWFFLGAVLIAGLVGLYLFVGSVDQSNKTALISNTTEVNELTTAENSVEKQITNITNKSDGQISNQPKYELGQIANESKSINNSAQDMESESNEEYINTISKVRSSHIVAQNSFQSENTGSLVKSEVVSVSSSTGNLLPLAESMGNVSEAKNSKATDREIFDDFTVNQESPNARELYELDFLNRRANALIEISDKKEEDFVLQMTRPTSEIIASSSTRYVFTAFGSSDFSSVGFFPDPQFGFTIGGKAGLQLARKFQLDLGFAYSLKRYGSEGLDYKIEGGWNEMVGINPTSMDGKGNILQIPIEATYYINGYENNGFFVNAGVSSFLLNSEWYGFEYDPEDLLLNPNVPLIEEITMDDITRRNFHLAGVARVSVGYQKILSPYMAFEVSPYLQIPLTGIGEGKVDLYTAGVQFAVKFNTK